MRNAKLDILRALAAFLVVCIHVKFPGNFGEYISAIAAVAVPIFFMITGYYYEQMKKQEKIQKQLRKICKLIVITIGIYILYGTIITCFKGNSILEYYKSIFNIKEIVKFLVFNEFSAIGHLWYLPAILYTLILAKFMTNKKNKKYLKFIIPIIFIVYIITGKYSKIVFGSEFPYYYFRRSFLIEGTLYFYLGYLIKEYEDKINVSINKLYLTNLILLIGTFIEMYILDSSGNNVVASNYICISLMPISILLCAIKETKFINPNNLFAKIGRKYSTTIYIIHPLIIDIMDNCMQRIKLYEIYSFVVPIIVYVVSIFLAFSADKIRIKVKGKNK